ncbi:hypothetical protein [Streptomyces cucumeris]|uniref:hypothetical protein n=1 Tax=Streptomyces cucumeris TaxID=2962890 RepID=UPI0020C84A82|nr:hypothetical protein [Streptomyces sp. NEAU-Y11]MCP9211916.1 hypothetical protein [Streptomyces sp. NEAU-Y11]
MITYLPEFEQVFLHTWRDDPKEETPSLLSVVYEPTATGRRWLLWAGPPSFREFVPFDDADHVREFARAVLDLPATAVPYERDVDLAEEEPEDGADPAGLCAATVTVGRDTSADHRPYLAYWSYYVLPGSPEQYDPGPSVFCRDPDVGRLHSEARALLTALDGG